jgi:NADPH:quinone reductase-like Zn-dependent oxidoreductase
MLAIQVHEGGELRHETVTDPVPAPGEVVVELRAAALNRRDLLVAGGTYPFPLPLIPGSDGAGVRRDTGEEVVIFPTLAWGEREEVQGPDFQILGGPRNGTYAELVVVPEANVFAKPARLSWEEAAALPLAGLTAYRALFSRGGLRVGETVLVLGAGSGVSTFAVQLAAQAGARVIVTSSSADKIERSVALGAEGGVNRCRGRLDRLDVATIARVPAPGRACRRLRRDGRHRGNAARAAVLLRPVVAARDDDGQPRRLRGPPRSSRIGHLATGGRLRSATRGGCSCG